MTIAWIDASMGASGDMLLGAILADLVPNPRWIESAINAVAPEPVTLRLERVTRNGLAATRCHVEVTDSTTHRTWADIRQLLEGADLHERTRFMALRTFSLLAEAEARAHGTTPDEVHFHEVGALDAIADVVGVCEGLRRVDRVVCSPVALGGGHVDAAHGRMSVPVPAVVDLLRLVPTYGGPVDMELCTPTGAALLRAWAAEWGPQPAMEVLQVGVGAGARDPDGHANVLRLVVGERLTAALLETNVDDLDPRLWPAVIESLLAAGAADAWLTPIVMKKGRPAHTLSVLAPPERAEAVRTEIFRQTSSIGLRESVVGKHALDREFREVEVDGHPIAVKIASQSGVVLNAQPEYEHVAAAARALGRPVKDVLAEAAARARDLAP